MGDLSLLSLRCVAVVLSFSNLSNMTRRTTIKTNLSEIREENLAFSI